MSRPRAAAVAVVAACSGLLRRVVEAPLRSRSGTGPLLGEAPVGAVELRGAELRDVGDVLAQHSPLARLADVLERRSRRPSRSAVLSAHLLLVVDLLVRDRLALVAVDDLPEALVVHVDDRRLGDVGEAHCRGRARAWPSRGPRARSAPRRRAAPPTPTGGSPRWRCCRTGGAALATERLGNHRAISCCSENRAVGRRLLATVGERDLGVARAARSAARSRSRRAGRRARWRRPRGRRSRPPGRGSARGRTRSRLGLDLHDLHRERRGDRQRRVGRAGVDDDDLVGRTRSAAALRSAGARCGPPRCNSGR